MESYLYQDLYNLEDQHWWHRAKRALVLEAITSLQAKKILKKNPVLLDVGCGAGRNIQAFQKHTIAHGIDLSAEAISFCKKRGLNTIKKSPAEKTPYGDNSFEIITALDIIEHADDQAVIKECWRILKPGGSLIITAPAYQWLWSKWDEALHHKRRYTSSSLKSVLKNQRFKVYKISYVYSFLLIPTLLIRIIKNMFYKNNYPSDFSLSNNWINTIMEQICSVERFLLWQIGIPFGTSILAIAVKPKKP